MVQESNRKDSSEENTPQIVPQFRKPKQGRRHKFDSPLHQVRYLQRRCAEEANKPKITGNTLAQLARAWSALDERRLVILAALRDKRSQKQHMSSDLAVPSSVSGAPDNEVTFLESIPESLSGEFDSQEFQTRKPPTRKDPGEEDPEVREDTDEEA